MEIHKLHKLLPMGQWHEFVDTRTILIRYKMESTVSKKINEMGISSSTEPPIKIIVNK